MIKALLCIIVSLGMLLILVMWHADNLARDKKQAIQAAELSESRVKSLRGAVDAQRDLAEKAAKTETTYQAEVKDAQEEAERLRNCIADGTCGLRVAATCPSVRMDRAATAAGEPDAGAPRLTAAAERAYPALVAGLKTQRAQIKGLQEQLITLHGKCRIGG